ncbi:MAG TPA: FAD-dependent oxidoreductase [Dehalococcoidia bacterium]|nr:FAD-dependent oxidoreductase [Dehalococcoidia bacterium]
MPGKTVLILGGGTGGLVAAHRLRRMLGKEHRVVLVDRTAFYSFAPSFTWVMLGKRDGRRITRDLRSLEKRGIELVTGEVQAIDVLNKRVVVARNDMAYDYLVVALGAQYSSDEIPGLGQSWTFYHLEGAEGLAERLRTFTSGRVAIVVSALPYRSPPALYEGALLLDDLFRRRDTRRDIEIHVYTPEQTPLSAAGPSVGNRIVELLSERAIGFTPGANLTEVDHRSRQMRFADGKTAAFDLLVATPVHRLPDVVGQAGLAPAGGWVQVDPETLATTFVDVYAIGDIADISIGDDRTLPKMGLFAHGQAEVVARNIEAEVAGTDPIWAFGGQGGCFMSTGADKAAYIVGNYFAAPVPDVKLRGPNRRWHWAKLGFERLWLWRWF